MLRVLLKNTHSQFQDSYPFSSNDNILIGVVTIFSIGRLTMRMQSLAARIRPASLASALGAHLFDLQFHNSDLVTIGDA
jgi:hypothetical protein